MAIHAVIMAGGSGTRFWPLSRKTRPKQLLPLGPGSASLLAETVRRVSRFVPIENILIATSELLADAIAADVPMIRRENILAEPTARNTAPCVGWATATIARRDPAAVVAVFPADHHIGDEARFESIVQIAIEAAGRGEIVTVGIEPDRPETGYGYLESGEDLGGGVRRCKRFVEKPDRKRAEEFLAAGNFSWNSGMFFFGADVMLRAIEANLPALAEALARFDAAAAAGDEQAVVRRDYGALPDVSIDSGVMEKIDRILLVPGSFDWSDLGSFQAAWELADKDASGNSAPSDAVLVDAEGCFVRSANGKTIAIVGLSDVVVVDTDDAILIVPRSRDQDIKKVVEALRARGSDRL